MSLNFLPKDIENIIYEKKNELEHSIKFSKVLNELTKFVSKRQKLVEYHYEWNSDIWELWCYNEHDTIICGESLKNGYVLIQLYDEYDEY